MSEKPRTMAQYKKHGKPTRFVKINVGNGKRKEMKVLSIMVDVWMGGARSGMVPYHANKDLADNSVGNIKFATREELGKLTGADGKRMPVVKMTEDGEVVAVYRSARAAAKENHMSYQTVLDRCHGKVKNRMLWMDITMPLKDRLKMSWGSEHEAVEPGGEE